MRWRSVLPGALLLAVACEQRWTVLPRYVGQPTSSLGEVRYPPPPARAESVPPRPRSDAVWIDGEWTWQGRRWSWRPGRWTVAPPGASFSPWTVVRDRLGTLYMASGTWRDAAGRELPEPPPLATAVPGAGAASPLPEEGEDRMGENP